MSVKNSQYMNANIFVQKARELIDTPYQHQGRLPGIAIDCLGVVVLAAKNANLLPDNWQDITDYKPNTHDLLDRLLEYGDRLNYPVVGTIACFANTHKKLIPRHLGIIAEKRGELSVIHASAKVERCIEQPFQDLSHLFICSVCLTAFASI